MRAPDPSDGRRNVVSLTAAGRRQVTTLNRARAAVQDELLAALSPKERARLVGLLTRTVDAHAPDAGR